MSIDISNYYTQIQELRDELKETREEKREYFKAWQDAEVLNAQLCRRCDKLEEQLLSARTAMRQIKTLALGCCG